MKKVAKIDLEETLANRETTKVSKSAAAKEKDLENPEESNVKIGVRSRSQKRTKK